MSTRFFSFLLFIFSFSLVAQTNDIFLQREERQGNLFFKVGVEYRVTPIYSVPVGGFLNAGGFYTNVDGLHNGTAISYGIEYFISKSLSISFVNSLRHEPFLYPFRSIETDFGAIKPESALLLGFHGYFDYHIRLFRQGELFFRLGISTYNGGSEFIYKQSFFNDEGEPDGAIDLTGNFKNTGINGAMGYSKDKIKFLIGVYTSQGGTFFTSSFDIFTPYIKLTYTFGKL